MDPTDQQPPKPTGDPTPSSRPPVPPSNDPTDTPGRLDRFVAAYPHAPLTAPFVAFLALMALESLFGPAHKPWLYAVRTFGALGVALLFRRYWPPLGKIHLPIAVVVGLVVALGWVVVHKWFAAADWYPYTQVLGRDATPDEFYIPHERLGIGLAYWLFLLVRIGGAATVVPLIEEFFWRGFVLRFLINPSRFEDVPLGTFTWISFIGCSLLSAAEHPMWEVGILCWVVYNLLFYWKRSLLCLMVTHGITNLALYIYVVIYQDWVFW